MRGRRPGRGGYLTILLWLFMVFILSVIPGRADTDIPHIDKILHFVIYAITCALFISTLRTEKRTAAIPFPAAAALAVFLSTLYGFFMEAVQIPLRTRGFSMDDVAADFLGSLAAALYLTVRVRRTKR